MNYIDTLSDIIESLTALTAWLKNNKLMRFFLIAFTVLLFVSLSTTSHANKNQIKKSLSFGLFYGVGEFHDGDNNTLASVPFSLTVQKKRTTLKFSSSYLYAKREDKQNGYTLKGIGTSYMSAKHLFKTVHFSDYLDLEGKIKVLEDDTSGELDIDGYDFRLSSTAYFWVAKNWLTAKAGYTWRSNDLNNTLLGAVGLSRPLSSQVSIGTILEAEQATQSINSNRIESIIHLTWKPSTQTKYTFYVIKGFADQRLNWGAGLQVSFYW